MMNTDNLNYIAEFSDIELEKEFFQQDMRKSLRYIKPIMLVLGLLNTLFLIPDYFLVRDAGSFRLIAVSRLSFLLLVVMLYGKVSGIKNYRVLAYWTTAYEAAAVLIFLFVFYQYEEPDFLIQAFGVMVILLAVFMVPNRWINMVVTSLFVSAGFFLMSAYYMTGLPFSKFSAGIVYIIITIILCGIFSYRTNYYKRVQFAASKELTRLSTTDPLTGAFNRAKFDEELKFWIEYSHRYKTHLSLVMFDVDDFKNINDTFGHLVGDSVIVECANIVRSGVRENDIFARWGGEEFVILLPNADRGKAADMAKRMRQKIEDHVFNMAGRVTCSFGVAQLGAGDGVESIMQKVDHMLYTAKKAGKNVVIG